MKKVDLSETDDTFIGAASSTERRTFVIHLREHGGRRYVKLSTFAKNREKGYWYLTKQFYMMPIECAAEIGKAIIAASKGQSFGDPPAWWADSQIKYREWQARKAAEADETPDVDRADTL